MGNTMDRGVHLHLTSPSQAALTCLRRLCYYKQEGQIPVEEETIQLLLPTITEPHVMNISGLTQPHTFRRHGFLFPVWTHRVELRPPPLEPWSLSEVLMLLSHRALFPTVNSPPLTPTCRVSPRCLGSVMRGASAALQ